MSAPVKVLLLGGHGRVALKLTPLLLAKSWNVTSVVRNPDHESELQSLAKGQPGKLEVLVESIDDVKSDADASKVLDKVKPNWVIWAAGKPQALIAPCLCSTNSTYIRTCTKNKESNANPQCS